MTITLRLSAGLLPALLASCPVCGGRKHHPECPEIGEDNRAIQEDSEANWFGAGPGEN